MKTINRICQVLAIVFSFAALVLFFMKFATMETANGSVSAIGAQLGFGSKLKLGDATYDMAKSADILVCFWLTVIGFVLSIFSFKAKTVRYYAPAFGLAAAIYMLVVTASSPWKFVDTRPLPGVTGVTYAPFVMLTMIALFLFAIAAAAYLLIDDYIEAKATGKPTIAKRVIRFFRDYKSEVKKIVWPGFKEVLRNTLIVLIMCLVVGILIWLLDFGLGKLLSLILGIK